MKISLLLQGLLGGVLGGVVERQAANATVTATATATSIATTASGPHYSAHPCSIVSQVASFAREHKPTAIPEIAIQLAYDCLASVPLDINAAVALVESILPYVEWQSDISYLKNPPPGYLEPAIDIKAALNTIIAKIKSGVYPGEYAFQADLLKTFNAVHDGHFRFVPDLVGKAFAFRRPVQIVSVSRDGVELPKVYVRYDITAYNKANSTSMPSALTKINGQPVIAFLEELAQLGFLQDPDALYNNLMYEMAFDSQSPTSRYHGYFALDGRYGLLYPGINTTIEFENGTVNNYPNYAELRGDFRGVVDGKTMYQKFCAPDGMGRILTSASAVSQSAVPTSIASSSAIPKSAVPFLAALSSDASTSTISSSASLTSTASSSAAPSSIGPGVPPRATVAPFGYPTPKVISADQQVAGYFLDDPVYADVAVLTMVSFSPSYPAEFQAVIQSFLATAKAAGKTKIVIDLSSNGGGNILAGYDAFRQFFPNIMQDGFSRLRQHDAFKLMSRGVSQYDANFSTSSNNAKDYLAHQSVLNYRFDYNETNGPFATYNDKFTSQKFNGDEYTEIIRWDMSDSTLTTNPVWGFGATITGYGDRKNFTQTFDSSNIVMLYDGYCASTCVIFSEFMRLQANVKSIAMGGRPNTNPIQAIGGTKGANNYGFRYIRILADLAIATLMPDQAINKSSLQYSDLPLNRSIDASVNSRDNILRNNLEDGIPAQFIYEAADCRLFYEPNMITDVTSIWKKAAKAAWGGGKCVAGAGFPKKVETRNERLRRSEEMKVRALTEPEIPLRPRSIDVMMLRQLKDIHGEKIPL